MKLRQAKGNSIITLIQKEASLAVIDNHVKNFGKKTFAKWDPIER